MTDSFAAVLSRAMTSASEQGYANLIGKVASASNKKKLADKLNRKLNQFGSDVLTLVIGVQSGLVLTKEAQSQERPKDFRAATSVTYKKLTPSWLATKKKHGLPTPSYFHFGGKRKGKNRSEKTLQNFLTESLQRVESIFGSVQAKDIHIFLEGQEVKLRGGRYSASDKAIRDAGGVSGNRIRNFSPKVRQYEVRVSLLSKVPISLNAATSYKAQLAAAALIDPEAKNKSSGFARAKLSKHAFGRPNVGYLLMWYHRVKLPAVIRSHYSSVKFLGN